MSPNPGQRVGPYEILNPIGAGGMGEVFRARDTRLERDVALKILPGSYAEDPARLRRFHQEGRAAGVLNHPNVLVIYDVGTHDGTPYVVSELLEGQTLRERMDGTALPPRKALDCAQQIARGLAAAHEKGIVHRDLKPENLFLTKDGRLKILDFGLAKPTAPLPAEDDSTGSMATNPGVVLGTVGYLSPEQVRGLPADHRSDIFAFGSVLFEMLTGRRAFRRETTVETMAAILREEPDLALARVISPALGHILEHCLEKDPEQRFQSARDLTFALEELGIPVSQSSVSAVALRGWRALTVRRGSALALLCAALVGGLVDRGFRGGPAPAALGFHQLTFRRGNVRTARFAPDGETILYSAAWQGEAPEVFSTRPESPESRSLGVSDAHLLAVSSQGELAVLLHPHVVEGLRVVGTLARVPFGGGVPREVLEDAEWADWAPDGMSLAAVRRAGDKSLLEFPVGTLLYRTEAWVTHPRVSPDGRELAFLEHPDPTSERADVVVLDRTGTRRTRSGGWSVAQGLAWSGKEVWLTGAHLVTHRALHALSPTGAERLVAEVPGTLNLEDIGPRGRALVTEGIELGGIAGLTPGFTAERDLSWLDFSVATDLSADGARLLFHEVGAGVGHRAAVYLRGTDGSPAVRLGEGESSSLSPDGKWALALVGTPPGIVLLPTRAGQPRPVPLGSLACELAKWLPDGRRLLVLAHEAGSGSRLYVKDVDGGPPRAITPVAAIGGRFPVSPDGRFVATTDPRVVVYPVEGGEPTLVEGAAAGEVPIQWSTDQRALYLRRNERGTARIDRLDLATGRRQPWRDLAPTDPAGIVFTASQLLTPDGRWYVYSYIRRLSDLYLVNGL